MKTVTLQKGSTMVMEIKRQDGTTEKLPMCVVEIDSGKVVMNMARNHKRPNIQVILRSTVLFQPTRISADVAEIISQSEPPKLQTA